MVLRRRFSLKKLVVIVPSFLVFIVLALVTKNSIYLLSEFIFVSNNAQPVYACNAVAHEHHIPLIMHQMFGFKDLKMDRGHILKRRKWTNVHQSYTHHLWNETTVMNLIQSEYGHLYDLFKSYKSWIQRADVGRYVVMYHYGGWYVDIDIGCNAGIHDVAEEAFILRKHVVLRETLPVGTSNDIFGITLRHSYLKSVLDQLPNANRWFVIPHWNILLSAGSTYMWGRYLNYPCKNDVIILEEGRYKKYFQIDHDGSWHSWDTGTINILFAFVQNIFCMSLLFLLIGILMGIFLRLSLSRRFIRKIQYH